MPLSGEGGVFSFHTVTQGCVWLNSAFPSKYCGAVAVWCFVVFSQFISTQPVLVASQDSCLSCGLVSEWKKGVRHLACVWGIVCTECHILVSFHHNLFPRSNTNGYIFLMFWRLHFLDLNIFFSFPLPLPNSFSLFLSSSPWPFTTLPQLLIRGGQSVLNRIARNSCLLCVLCHEVQWLDHCGQASTACPGYLHKVLLNTLEKEA